MCKIKNYDMRYRSRDSEHSSRTLGRGFDYTNRLPGGIHNRFEGMTHFNAHAKLLRYSGREIIEIIEEVDTKEEPTDLETAQPYIFMTLAIIGNFFKMSFLRFSSMSKIIIFEKIN